MTTQLPPEFRTKAFEFENSTDDSPDVWVNGEYVNQYGDTRVVLGGDTYDVFVKGDVKADLDWDITHHKFEDPLPFRAKDVSGEEKAWTVDKDGLMHLAEVAEESGFTVETSEGQVADDDPLFDVVEFVEVGGEVEVTYEKKNGNGRATKSGEVTAADVDTGEPIVVFRRDDGQVMRVRPDEFGEAGLFSGGYHPFVGSVVEVEVEN